MVEQSVIAAAIHDAADPVVEGFDLFAGGRLMLEKRRQSHFKRQSHFNRTAPTPA
jgi:hypothetical protein